MLCAAAVITTLAPARDYCDRCGRMEHLNDDKWCDTCYSEIVEDTFSEDELEYVHIKTDVYFEDLTEAMRAQLKPNPRQFKYMMAPFSLEAFKTLRRYILFYNSGIALPQILQRKGQRGGKVKEWVMQVEDTATFMKLVSIAWPEPGTVTYGTGQAYSTDAVAAWVPPLYAVLRASDQAGTRNTVCTWRMAGGRMTQAGFSFSQGFNYTAASANVSKRYLSLHTVRLQQARLAAIAKHQQTPPLGSLQLPSSDPPPPPPLDHGLVVKAATTMQQLQG